MVAAAGDIVDIAVRAVGELIVTAAIEAISIAVSTYLSVLHSPSALNEIIRVSIIKLQ